LPKGHVEPEVGETVSEAAKREVQEEAGISSLSVKDQLGVTKYSFQAEEALVRKTVHYFLMTTDQKKLTPQAEENLLAAEWQPIDRAINQLAYETDKHIVAKAKSKLTGQPLSTRHTSHPAPLATGPRRRPRPSRRPQLSGPGPLRIHT